MDGTGLIAWVGFNNAAGTWLGGMVVTALVIFNENWTSLEGEPKCNNFRYCSADSISVDVGEYH